MEYSSLVKSATYPCSLEVVDFVVAGEIHVACGSDDFNLRCENLECEVEAYLVVSGACRAVGNAVRADFLCIFDYGYSLKIRSELTDIGYVPLRSTLPKIIYLIDLS